MSSSKLLPHPLMGTTTAAAPMQLKGSPTTLLSLSPTSWSDIEHYVSGQCPAISQRTHELLTPTGNKFVYWLTLEDEDEILSAEDKENLATLVNGDDEDAPLTDPRHDGSETIDMTSNTLLVQETQLSPESRRRTKLQRTQNLPSLATLMAQARFDDDCVVSDDSSDDDSPTSNNDSGEHHSGLDSKPITSFEFVEEPEHPQLWAEQILRARFDYLHNEAHGARHYFLWREAKYEAGATMVHGPSSLRIEMSADVEDEQEYEDEIGIFELELDDNMAENLKGLSELLDGVTDEESWVQDHDTLPDSSSVFEEIVGSLDGDEQRSVVGGEEAHNLDIKDVAVVEEDAMSFEDEFASEASSFFDSDVDADPVDANSLPTTNAVLGRPALEQDIVAESSNEALGSDRIPVNDTEPFRRSLSCKRSGTTDATSIKSSRKSDQPSTRSSRTSLSSVESDEDESIDNLSLSSEDADDNSHHNDPYSVASSVQIQKDLQVNIVVIAAVDQGSFDDFTDPVVTEDDDLAHDATSEENYTRIFDDARRQHRRRHINKMKHVVRATAKMTVKASRLLVSGTKKLGLTIKHFVPAAMSSKKCSRGFEKFWAAGSG